MYDSLLMLERGISKIKFIKNQVNSKLEILLKYLPGAVHQLIVFYCVLCIAYVIQFLKRLDFY
jgi:hypothetical protein